MLGNATLTNMGGRGLQKLMTGKATKQSYVKAATYMGILMPNLFVAPIRYFAMDETPDVRNRMFYRDVLAAALGVGFFYATRLIAGKALARNMTNKESRDLAATFVAWVSNVLVQGIGAVKLSEWMSKRETAKKALVSSPQIPQTPPPQFRAAPRLPAPAIPRPVNHPVMPVRQYSPQPQQLPQSVQQQRYFRSPQFVPPVMPYGPQFVNPLAGPPAVNPFNR